MIKKSKKIMASMLLALSLMAILPTTNVLAVDRSLTQEENSKYIQFINNECTQTSWNNSIYYNKNTGKYYLVILSDDYGLTMAKNKGGGNGYYGKEDGSLAQNEWIYNDIIPSQCSWWYFGSDYKGVTGYQTINGKYYYFNKDGDLFTGWKKRATDGGEPSKDWKERLANSRWFYYGEDGVIKEGWVNSGGKWYYIYSNGVMASDTTTPDGYHVDKNGVWVS